MSTLKNKIITLHNKIVTHGNKIVTGCGGGATTKYCWYQFTYTCATDVVSLISAQCYTDAEAAAVGLTEDVTEAWAYDSGYSYWRKGATPCTDSGDCGDPGETPGRPDDLSHCPRYRKVFRCDTNELVSNIGVDVPTADAITPYTSSFKIIVEGAPLDNVCYYMDGTETTIRPAIVVTAVASDFSPTAYAAGWPGDGFFGEGGWSTCEVCLGPLCDDCPCIHFKIFDNTDTEVADVVYCDEDSCVWNFRHDDNFAPTTGGWTINPIGYGPFFLPGYNVRAPSPGSVSDPDGAGSYLVVIGCQDSA